MNIIGIKTQSPIDFTVSVRDEVIPFWNKIIPIPIINTTIPM